MVLLLEFFCLRNIIRYSFYDEVTYAVNKYVCLIFFLFVYTHWNKSTVAEGMGWWEFSCVNAIG